MVALVGHLCGLWEQGKAWRDSSERVLPAGQHSRYPGSSIGVVVACGEEEEEEEYARRVTLYRPDPVQGRGFVAQGGKGLQGPTPQSKKEVQ